MVIVVSNDYVRNFKSKNNKLAKAEGLSTYAMTDGGSTIVKLEVWVKGKGEPFWLPVSGVTRCNPHDEYNEQRGIDVALGKALKEFKQKAEFLGVKVVKKEDNNGTKN